MGNKTSAYLYVVPDKISFRNLINGLEVHYEKKDGRIIIKEQNEVMVFVFPEELEWLIDVLRDIREIQAFKVSSEEKIVSKL